jgi:hypothetical protein
MQGGGDGNLRSHRYPCYHVCRLGQMKPSKQRKVAIIANTKFLLISGGLLVLLWASTYFTAGRKEWGAPQPWWSPYAIQFVFAIYMGYFMSREKRSN